ncbi:uncharacterized protein LOC134637035 [Pelmatolapia mariae]|uniref:uncharacterized protein LOC134637035 n=1 Tax=Pelmatolapia mariae TaxID=158779 RepID=UPI002FE5E33E
MSQKDECVVDLDYCQISPQLSTSFTSLHLQHTEYVIIVFTQSCSLLGTISRSSSISNMNGLLILGVLLFIPGQSDAHATVTPSLAHTDNKSTTVSTTISPASKSSAESQPATRSVSTTSITTTTTEQTPTTTQSVFQKFKSECLDLYILSGIMLLICGFCMISTLILLCKVCQLRRRLRTDGEPVSNNEYWMGTDNKVKSKSDSEREAKESTMLMAELTPAQGETNNGTIKEDGENVKEDEKTPEEKAVGDAANSEEASATPVTAAEDSPSPNPQAATEAQPSQAVDAASSEGKEEGDVEKK